MDERRATRFSILDRSLTAAGRSPGEALRDTVALAAEADRLGYHRFWVSEHHALPGVAGAAPTVLAAAVAATTGRIRVGTGGVMLPNHPPLVVAEQFGVLASLHPGRVDMGLGRSIGFTPAVRRALGAGQEDAEDFEARLVELLGHFEGHSPVRAVPAEGLPVPAFVLATGGGAEIAAHQGLPVVLGGPEERVSALADRYRAAFRPSRWLAARETSAPYVVVAANAAAAVTPERAALLQAPEAWSVARSRTRGTFPGLSRPDEVPVGAMTASERRHYDAVRSSQVHGTGEQVAAALAGRAERVGADEVLLTLHTHDPLDRLASYRGLAPFLVPGAVDPPPLP